MPQLRSSTDVDVSAFLADGLGIKQHLSRYLDLTLDQLEQRLPSSTDDLADLHPGAFRPEDATAFYEDTVGTRHLLELAAWHLSSADYIADTLRLQGMAVQGQVLDFGGGIGTHAPRLRRCRRSITSGLSTSIPTTRLLFSNGRKAWGWRTGSRCIATSAARAMFVSMRWSASMCWNTCRILRRSCWNFTSGWPPGPSRF